ncbi:unnamed protein product [Nippostrongylus brasiliensis]|uniref:Craniofacial development protein 2-like n=1 Tax=Nippostrongylus brasiliensis TaxID=27835 RepID=A0A0N4YKH5_NIPBR|nr:unnamed protein product [Nippostrongylus brasiliensis]
MVVAAGDLNGHVGISKYGFKCHGGFGYGIRNEDDVMEVYIVHLCKSLLLGIDCKDYQLRTVPAQPRFL